MPAPLRNIRLTLAYDGTSYGGWQRQKNAPSLQEELEAALATMHGRRVPVAAAGRTDAGVHALGQVANFYTDIASIPARNFLPALNKLLPAELRVLEAAEAHFDFHSRFDARLRRYRYFTLCARSADPFRLRYAHRLLHRPELGRLNAMASLLLGEVDFSSLSSARDPSASKKRYVHEASFRWEGELLVFEIAANAFLLRMVRSIVGSLLHFEAQGREPAYLAEVLAARDRSLAGATAPARGLFLWNVEYYPEPRKPGRGAYWSRRGLEGEAAAGEEGAEEGEEEGGGEGEPAAGPRGSLPRPEEPRPRGSIPRPEEPRPRGSIPRPEEPRGRLVPGLGYVKE